jgi:hypothetical protein
MKENILSDKSYRFALRIIKLYQHLAKQHEPAKLAESLLADRVELQKLITGSIKTAKRST